MQPPKQDHYRLARQAAAERLRRSVDPQRLEALGARLDEGARTVTVPSLCWEFRVQLDPFAMAVLPMDAEVADVWQVLVLEYLTAPNPVTPSGFLSFADFAEGRGYLSAFESRVTRRLSATAGRARAAFLAACERLGAAPTQDEPVRCIFRFLPLLELQVVRHEGDEDFPPSCNVLFSDNLLSVASMEGGIVAAERLVSALEGKTPAVRRAGAP
jgi:hypothetical protein